MKHLRRILVTVAGGTVLVAGVALIFLPGPAFIVIPLGLAILAIEFAWARRWLGYARQLLQRNKARSKQKPDTIFDFTRHAERTYENPISHSRS